MNCLLCNSNKIVIKETHPRKALADLWSFVDISDELKLDEIMVYQCTNCSLKFFDPKLAGGDKFYSELGKLDWYYLHPGKTEYDYVQKYINQNDKILDVGAGRGVLFTKIAKKVNYTGLELSTKAVELAQEAGINVKQEDLIIHADAHKLHYDMVCLFQVLEHLTELDSFIKSVHLTLKSKGLFVIAVPNNDSFISYAPNYTFNLPPHHTILWTENSLRFLAKKYDFDIVEIQKELLQDVHKEDAYKAYLANVFRKIIFQPNLLINNSKSHYYISKAINLIYNSKLLKEMALWVAKRKVKYGQSIIITLQKK